MTNNTEINKLTYEQSFEELQTLITALEEGEMPLEETLKLYERGQALFTRCQELLEQAELKVQELDQK